VSANGTMRRVRVIDSHTAGEPTRVVVDGGPDLGTGPMAARRDRFESEHDTFRRALVSEPRGSETVVGALLLPPEDPAHTTGLIFFNNAGYLGMCGHGTIGVVTTLGYLGRLNGRPVSIETPVGTVNAEMRDDGRVSFRNVASYRARAGVELDVPGYGRVTGDVAWGGNWFFLTDHAPVELTIHRVRELTAYTAAVRDALQRGGVTAENGAPIEHVEVFGPPERPENDSRNFVLCPGGAYDRSPCGTGTSAKIAALVEDGRLAPGTTWRQEGILGTVFEAVAEPAPRGVLPRITGAAYLTADAQLLLDERDPLCYGVPG
jgi:4-hydroxyproline epimerase